MAIRQPLDVQRELLEAFEHSCRATELLVGALPRRLWDAPSPLGEGRTIAAIVAHMHSIPRTFANMGGAEPPVIALDRASVTPAEARRALRQSREALIRLFRDALSAGSPRVKGMPRRVVSMLTYLLQHDAHHRGQIAMLARAMGHRLSKDESMRIWGWKKLTADKS